MDESVLGQIAKEIRGKEFVGQVVQGAHAMADSMQTNPAILDQALRSVAAKIANVANALADAGKSPALITKLRDLEVERAGLVAEREATADRAKLKGALRSIKAKDVDAMLEFTPLTAEADIAYVRRSLGALVKRIDLNPDARTFRVQYSITPKGGANWRPQGDSNPCYRRERAVS